MRQQEGPAVMAIRAATKAHELLANGAEAVVLDGLYSWSEDKFLRKEFGNDVIVIAMISSKELRYERAVNRTDKKVTGVRKYTREDVIGRDIHEIENSEKGGPIAFADEYVLNNGDLNNMHAQLDKIISSYQK
jgi:dephospho-CoA kinase